MTRGKSTVYDTQAKQGCPHGHNPFNCDICLARAKKCCHGLPVDAVCKHCEDDEEGEYRRSMAREE